MRVLLINTNRIKPPIAPLAIDYLGAAVRAAGHEVSLLDLCWEADADAAVARAFAAGGLDLAALTFRNTDDCYFASKACFLPVLAADVARVRRHFDGPIVVGGGGFTLMPVPLLERTGATYGVRGEGEEALPALLRALRGDAPFSKVPGLVYREGGAWVLNPPGQADLAALPLAARGLLDNRRYFEKGGQAGLETKRGCPGACVYCADPLIKGHRVRVRPPAQVVDEVRNLLAQGADVFHLCDSEFNLPARHATAVCRAIADAGLGDRIRWYTYASPVPLSPELAALMRQAGCAGINFGVDSGSDRMLRSLGRPYDAADILDTARACREAGLAIMFDLLLGGPGETWATVAETLEMVRRAAPEVAGVSLGVRVYPGTTLELRLRRASALPGDPAGAEPVFYVAPELGADPYAALRERIGGDPRFLLPSGGDDRDYNYNDNTVLQRAIDAGARGAYWDILRRLRNN